jgi:single-strand DNA-binding protein
MSDGINRVTLLGNVGSDPELRFTQGGTGVLSLSLATNESYVDRNQQRQERVEWHKIVVWGKRAEGLGKFVKKGFGLFVEGSLRTTKYTDRDGVERYKTEIVASNVIVTRGDQQGASGQHRESHASDHGAGSRQGYGAPRAQSPQRNAPQALPANDASPSDDFGYDGGDDIPF